MTTKKRAMRVCKIQSAESNNEVDIYTVKIPKTRATLFQFMRRYVVCGATFKMENNFIGAAYDKLANTSMWAYGDDLVVVIYIDIQRAAKFQWISDLLQHLWMFSIALDGATQQSTSYLDFQD